MVLIKLEVSFRVFRGILALAFHYFSWFQKTLKIVMKYMAIFEELALAIAYGIVLSTLKFSAQTFFALSIFFYFLSEKYPQNTV